MSNRQWRYKRVTKFADVEELALQGWRLVAAHSGVFYMELELEDESDEDE